MQRVEARDSFSSEEERDGGGGEGVGWVMKFIFSIIHFAFTQY